jgi:RNA polymerase sigma factor (sigma-70 family)
MGEATAPLGTRAGLAPARLLSDERLVRRVAAGDQRAFAAIYSRYHQRIYRYCQGIVGNPEDAQDALQNTMLKAMRALAGEEREIDLKPWLYRIAHNESIDLVRRRRGSEELAAESPAPGPGPAEDAQRRQLLRETLADIEELPERQRGAVVMRELDGLGFEEIAAALETSPAVARQTLYEARLGLRTMQTGRELNCDAVMRALSDADGRVARRRDLRAHLRACESCQAFRQEMRRRRADLAALAPLPSAAAAGILQGILGGGGSAGGGLTAALGAGAGKAVGTTAAVKAVATVTVVATIGVTAADRGGLVHIGPTHDGSGARSGGNSSRANRAVPSDSPAVVAGNERVDDTSRATGTHSTPRVHRAAAITGQRAPSERGATKEAPNQSAVATGPGDSGSHGDEASAPPGKAHGHEKAAAKQAAHPGQAHGTGKGKTAGHGHASGNAKAAGQSDSHGQGTTAAAHSHPAKPTHPDKPASKGNGASESPAAAEHAGGQEQGTESQAQIAPE